MKKSPSRRSQKKRVVLVDDHPMIRRGLAQVINQQDDLTVCGEASDANEAMERVAASKPDLAVVDISLEGKSGLELIKDLNTLHPEVRVLVMSMHDESLYVERVLRAGAQGYVMKRAGGEAMLQAIRKVLNGEYYVSERMTGTIMARIARDRSGENKSPLEMLTDREFEVFKLIGEGMITREIARQLRISPKTVDVHRQHLKEKFELPTTTSLIHYAIRWVETQNRR